MAETGLQRQPDGSLVVTVIVAPNEAAELETVPEPPAPEPEPEDEPEPASTSKSKGSKSKPPIGG
jgi:hypothetical protein